jgi:hypothetical protein
VAAPLGRRKEWRVQGQDARAGLGSLPVLERTPPHQHFSADLHAAEHVSEDVGSSLITREETAWVSDLSEDSKSHTVVPAVVLMVRGHNSKAT